jgi:hypothetical protein
VPGKSAAARGKRCRNLTLDKLLAREKVHFGEPGLERLTDAAFRGCRQVRRRHNGVDGWRVWAYQVSTARTNNALAGALAAGTR